MGPLRVIWKNVHAGWPTGGDELSYSGKSLFSIGESAIGRVTKFKALGQNLDNQDPNGYIKYRIGQATGQFHSKREMLTDHKNLKKAVRIDFLESFVRSPLTYGVEGERPPIGQISLLSSFWSRSLSQMTAGGYSRNPGDDGEDSMAYKYSNADLDRFFDTPPIKGFMDVRFLKYIAHIVRRENTHPTERALFIQPHRPNADTVWRKVQFT